MADSGAPVSWQVLHSDSGITDLFASQDAEAVWVSGARSARLGGELPELLSLPGDSAQRLVSVHGTGADDIFAVSERGDLIHFDGQGWGRVRGDFTGATRVFATESDVFIGAVADTTILARLQPW